MSGPTHVSSLSRGAPRGVLALGLLCAALAGACRGGAQLRPVVRSAPLVTRVTVTEIGPDQERPAVARAPKQAPTQASPGPTVGPFPRTLELPGRPVVMAQNAGAMLGTAPVQLDPGLGPIDLGYPLLVDLGAGDAPYDDGIPTLHAGEPKRGGFSDSVIQVTWREPLSKRVSLHGGAAIFRYQDLGILDSLPESRFGFAVVGIQFRL